MMMIVNSVLLLGFSFLYLRMAFRLRMLTEAAEDVFDHAVWQDEFGQWWNVYRDGAFGSEEEAFADLGQRFRNLKLIRH